jgi:hypothetical protein
MSTDFRNIVRKAKKFAHLLRCQSLLCLLETELTTLVPLVKMADEQTNPPTAADLASHRETVRLPNAPPFLSEQRAVSVSVRGLLGATRLRQSILKQAFEGKLVSQDPTDEPAGVLLERLRASRLGPERTNKTATATRHRGRGPNAKQREGSADE